MKTRKLTDAERAQMESGEGVEDLAVTCEADSGYVPCGRWMDWVDGRCEYGHEIEILDA